MGEEIRLGMESTDVALSQENANLRRQLEEAEYARDSLKLELAGLEQMRLRDNQYLLDERAELQARYDALRKAAADIVDRIEKWEEAVRMVIGRNVAHGMDLTELRALLADQPTSDKSSDSSSQASNTP